MIDDLRHFRAPRPWLLQLCEQEPWLILLAVLLAAFVADRLS